MGIFKNMDFHLMPAYGRDYKNQRDVRADWVAGKDFVLSTTGQYCSARDLKGLSGEVWIRYAKLTKIVKVQ